MVAKRKLIEKGASSRAWYSGIKLLIEVNKSQHKDINREQQDSNLRGQSPHDF
jgi:hypothetical protein